MTASFLVSPLNVDGNHDFLIFLMFFQNILGDLFHKALAMSCALYFYLDFRQALNAYLNSFLLPFICCQMEVHLWVYDNQSRISMLVGQPCAFFLHP